MKTNNYRKKMLLLALAKLLFCTLAFNLAVAQDGKINRDVHPNYKGWAGKPPSINVLIDPKFNEDQRNQIENAINKWNGQNCKPQLVIVPSGEFHIRIHKAAVDNDYIWYGLGGIVLRTVVGWLNQNSSDVHGRIHEVTGETEKVLIRINPSPGEDISIEGAATWGLGFALGLESTDNGPTMDEPEKMEDAMYGGYRENNIDGELQETDIKEIRQASKLSCNDLPQIPADGPDEAITPGSSEEIEFDLQYYPPGTAIVPTVTSFYDPKVIVESSSISYSNGSPVLKVQVTVDITHTNSKLYLMIELEPSPPYEPMQFVGYHFIHEDPVPPVTFECPFEIVLDGNDVYLLWEGLYAYPYEKQLRSSLLVNNMRVVMFPDGDYMVQLKPGENLIQLFVDDFRGNNASYSMIYFYKPDIPLSNWPIYLAIGLMLAVMSFFYFRRF